MYNQYNQPYNNYVQPYMAYPNRQQDIPFSEVRYGTLDQAKGYIVLPNRAVMFIDQDKSEFYINRADAMGKPYLETYKYYLADNVSHETKTSPETNKFDEFLTKKDAEMFLKNTDLEDVYKKLEELSNELKEISGSKK